METKSVCDTDSGKDVKSMSISCGLLLTILSIVSALVILANVLLDLETDSCAAVIFVNPFTPSSLPPSLISIASSSSSSPTSYIQPASSSHSPLALPSHSSPRTWALELSTPEPQNPPGATPLIYSSSLSSYLSSSVSGSSPESYLSAAVSVSSSSNASFPPFFLSI